LPIFMYAPCRLHMYISITKTLFWTTYEALTDLGCVALLTAHLKALKLQYLEGFLRKLEQSVEKHKLNVIGRDCQQLEAHMARILAEIKETMSSRREQSQLSKLVDLWRLWTPAASHIFAVSPDKIMVDKCQSECLEFFRFFVQQFDYMEVTWYLHFLKAHLHQFALILYEEFGFGFGILNTQAMEHQLKQLKIILAHTLRNGKKAEAALTQHHQCRYGWFGDVRKTRRITCSKCGIPGHMKTNKRKCKMYGT